MLTEVELVAGEDFPIHLAATVDQPVTGHPTITSVPPTDRHRIRQPIALPLERIARQRHPAVPTVAEQLREIGRPAVEELRGKCLGSEICAMCRKILPGEPIGA